METKYAILLDGRKAPQVIEFTAEQGTKKLDYYYKAIDCDTIDIVHTSMKDTCLVVDDEALFKEENEINVIASLLYGIRTHGQPIVGKALLTAEEYTSEGIECVGFPKLYAEALAELMNETYQPFLLK